MEEHYLGANDKEIQYKLSQKIIDEKLSVRETERLIKSLSKENNITLKQTESNPYYNDIRLKLKMYLVQK